MRAIVCVACVALVCGQVLQVPDYFFYRNSTALSAEDGITKWPAQGSPPHFRTLNPSGVSRISLAKKKQFPSKGGAYWVSTEATYVVVKGKVKMCFENGTEVELSAGDLFYSPAGVKHGPITNPFDDDAIVMSQADHELQFGKIPASIPTPVTIEQYAFHPAGKYGAAPPSAGLPDCITLAIFAVNGAPAAISANLEPGCTLPFHHHDTGVFYFYTQGVTRVSGDEAEPVDFSPGQARWARPGWAYGPEFAASTNERTIFMVLGLPPTVGPAPNTPELISRDMEPQPIQVSYENSQYHEDKHRPQQQTQHKQQTQKKRRVSRHLRSASEQDETAFLQAPPGSDSQDMYEDEL